MDHRRVRHHDGRDPLNERGFVKNLFDGGFESETALNLNDLVEQLPDACRDPEERRIEQEERVAWVQGWPEISRWAWLHPEEALELYPTQPGLDTDQRTALSHIADLDRKQRRMTWETYQEARVQCGCG